MARFILLLGSGLLLTGTAYAQVGVRAGGSWMELIKPPLNQLVGAASVTPSSQFGYHAGVYYQVPLSKRFSLVPEVQFSRERQHVTIDSNTLIDANSQSDYHLSLSYLNVPVLARITWGPVYLEAGPQASLLLGGYGKGNTTGYTWGTGPYTQAIDQAATDRYQRLDAGVCLGIGAQLSSGLGLSLRAYQGLVQLNRASTYAQASIPYTANSEYRQVLQASLTYRLPHRG